MVGDLEKSFGDFGEKRSVITLEIWRNAVGAVLAISYWSSLWISLELGDRNGEKNVMETNYGDQNFIHHKVKSTYLERFMDRNV